MRLRLRALAIAVATLLTPALAILPAGIPGAVSGVAAATGLTTTADARYVVDPGHHRVAVSVSLSATNHLTDTKTHRFFFDAAFLAVPPRTTGFKISSPGAHPSISVAARKSTYTLLRIAFGAHLAAGSTRPFTVSFTIADPGGAATRPTRIGMSLVRFSAWGLASDGATGGSVTVVFPAGFKVEVDAGAMAKTTDGAGNTVFSTGRLAQPTTFIASFVADRPSAFRESTMAVKVGTDTIPVTIRAWPDDPAWAKRVRQVVAKGLPVLAKDIGLPWTAGRPLVVEEALSRSSGGFAGRYDPSTRTIEIAYYADPFVLLHEAAHVWFDGSLLADRWANEGFASWYALRAAREIGLKTPAATKLTPALRAALVPLNAWAPPESADGAPTTAGGTVAGTSPAADAAAARTQAADSAAAITFAGLAASRAGISGLQSAWQAIREGRAAYQPVGAGVDLERSSVAVDWRGLLDILEDRSGADFSDLWTTWVVRPAEAGLLIDRATARDRYAATVARAGTWRLPRVVRDALRVWRYDELNDLLAAASNALDERDAVTVAARTAGLTPPTTMQTDFEGPRGFAAASAEADAELAAIHAYQQAAAAVPSDADVVAKIGMWNADPQGVLGSARQAFANGDLATTIRNSDFAGRIWSTAPDVGRNRILAVAGTLGAILLAAWLAFRWYRDRGVRRRSLLTQR